MATETKVLPVNDVEEKGGYPAGSKPVSQIKPPPASVSKPKTEAKG
jgi:hypothetical protein